MLGKNAYIKLFLGFFYCSRKMTKRQLLTLKASQVQIKKKSKKILYESTLGVYG
jgi:hypothetical protein